MLGMFSSHLSEAFWEVADSLRIIWWKMCLRGSFLAYCAIIYSESIERAGAPLSHCIIMKYHINIRMDRPDDGNSDQWAWYYGHKSVHWLLYQALPTPDRLTFFFVQTRVVGRREIRLLRKSGWNTMLSESVITDEGQFYEYGDSAYSIRLLFLRPFIGNITE